MVLHDWNVASEHGTYGPVPEKVYVFHDAETGNQHL